MLDASVVIVNYNSGDRLGRLLDPLAGFVRDVRVVDNASDDGSGGAANRDGVTIIRNPGNAGFAAAANQGAGGATAEWLVFLNPDVHPVPGDLAALLRDVPPDVGAVAPLQLDERGHPRPESGGHAPSIGRFAAWAVLPRAWRGNLGPWLAAPFPQADIDLAWVSGAALAVRREDFESLGGFDERFFLYQEDVDLCARLRGRGRRVLCRGHVRIFHEVADGDPRRRAEGTARFVAALGMQFRGWRRRILGLELLLGFGLRAVTGRADARAALAPSRALLSRRPSDP